MEYRIFNKSKKAPQIEVAKNIIEIVNNYFYVESRTKSRRAMYTYPRQLCQFLIKTYCDKLSEKDIATLTLIKSHATVRFSINKIESLSNFDAEIKDDLIVLTDELNAKLDLSKTSKSLEANKSRRLDVIRIKMMKLTDAQFFDLTDIINNHIKNYETWKV